MRVPRRAITHLRNSSAQPGRSHEDDITVHQVDMRESVADRLRIPHTPSEALCDRVAPDWLGARKWAKCREHREGRGLHADDFAASNSLI